MTIEEIRRANINALAEKITRKSLAEKLGYSDTIYLNQLCGGHGSFGNKTARKIERALRLETGWMDRQHPDPGKEMESTKIQSLMNSTGETIMFERYTGVEFSQGAGRLAEQDEYQVQSFEATRRWVQAKLSSITSPANVKIVTARGDSMKPTYSEGDALFLDTGVKTVDTDAVFGFRHRGLLYIKRVQILPGNQLKMISDNKGYDSFVVAADHRDEFEVLGRVVGSLNFNHS